MTAKLRQLSFALLLTLSCGAMAQSAPDVRKVAGEVDRHYNSLHSLTSDFSEHYEGAGVARDEQGTMALLKPGKMRWQYQRPAEKLFVTDGKTAFFYVPGDRQARKMPVKDLEDFRSPIRYLLGHSKLNSEFDGLKFSAEKPQSGGAWVLEGVPRNMKERVERVLLEVNAARQITRIRVEELDGSVTEFSFRNLKEDVQLEPAAFRFAPPPGVEVIEGNASF
jgi:outer membrane lipoprotein carrier protein